MVQEFKEFINRGGVVELAVAFIMGVAFKPIVDAIVERVLMPLIGMIFGQPNFDAIWTFGELTEDGIPAGSVGAVVTATVNFLLIAFALLGLHLYLVQRHGISVPQRAAAEAGGEGKVRSMPFVPHFLLRDMVGWYVALGLLAALAALFPWELGHKADPFGTAPPGIKPEWYFLFMFQTLKYLPAKILFIDGEVVGVLVFTLGGLMLFLVPFLNRTPGHGTRRRVFQIAGIAPDNYVITGFVPGGTPEMSWMVKSVTMNGENVADRPVAIKSDLRSSDVVITFTDRHAELSGRLVDSAGRPAPCNAARAGRGRPRVRLGPFPSRCRDHRRSPADERASCCAGTAAGPRPSPRSRGPASTTT